MKVQIPQRAKNALNWCKKNYEGRNYKGLQKANEIPGALKRHLLKTVFHKTPGRVSF
jgi:hypothetical protein